ncbi:hypothetical protein CANINC_004263 [Pichia inconspicua]|uniref:Mitochondrial carrier protein n=1 Tax=Pichia inconspicua TaxID=52247 RepID=A0A4T0WWA0_9ASCO|nr:hypothetical protein CANINC_004263 [[Candida] inconspicua]
MVMSSDIAGAIEEDDFMFESDIKGHVTTTQLNIANNQNDLTLSQRMLSACTGSLLTSLVVTPFDVVRIRLQQQELLYPVQSVSATCCRKVFWEATSGKPLGPIEGNLCQPNACFNDGAKISGTFQGIGKIAADEGICTLYRGLGLTLVMAIPSNVVYFSGYEFLRDSSPLKQDFPILNPLLCGSIARIVAATSVSPLELIKTRIQAVPTTTSTQGSTAIFKMVVTNTLDEIRIGGVGTVFKGLCLTLWRDVPFSGIYWATYEFITHQLRRSTILGEDSTRVTSETSLFARSFLGGSIAGIIAAVFTNPFDVGKTRMQVSFEDNNPIGSLTEKSTKSKDSIFKYISSIYKNEGFTALYVGLIPRCMKIAPACAIMISSYEMTKRFFTPHAPSTP